MEKSDLDLLAQAESELKFLLDDAGVPAPVQVLVLKCGYDSVRVFAGLDDSKEAVRKALREELPLDYTASPENRKSMALLLHVWDACRLQLSVQEKQKSEAKLGVGARLLPTTEHASMRLAVEASHGKLCDKEIPSKALLAQKLEQVEDNCPEAEDLREVTSVEDCRKEAYSALIADPISNTVRFKPGKAMTTPPSSPEDLRLRHRRIGLAWEMARSRHTNRTWLPSRCVDAFRKLSDHVLGSKIAGLRLADGYSPPWNIVLAYEAEVRSHACKLVRDGEAADLGMALSAACKASDLTSSFFIVPLTIAAAAPASTAVSAGGRPVGDHNPFIRSKGKGKGKGKEGVIKSIYKSRRSPGGKSLCFAYNKKKGCDRANCPFTHVCQRCFEDHPYVKCPQVQREGAVE